MKDQDLKQSEPSYYSVTPAPVRYSHINNGAKLLYGEITALSNKHGYCWATDDPFHYFLTLVKNEPKEQAK